MIMLIIECPNGTTFEQKISLNGQTVSKAIASYRKKLGKNYMICDWYAC